MFTSPTSPTTEPDGVPPGRSRRFSDGLRSIVRAVWFLISLLIYVLGSILYQAGRSLIAISGWGPHEPNDDAPKPPAPTANA